MCNYILLTGAGFSRDFGGFLADDMWSLISNEPSVATDNIIQNRLKRNGQANYEDVYSQLEQLEDRETNFLTYHQAVVKAYKLLHTSISGGIRDSKNGANELSANLFGKLIYKFIPFSGNELSKKAFFSLNQDVVIEHLTSQSEYSICLPGIRANLNVDRESYRSFRQNIDNFPKIETPTLDQNITPEINSLPFYKIHGSSNWRDENDNMIFLFGKDKHKKVKESEILQHYHNKLANFFSERTKLIIIGYSFNDENINKKINNNRKNIDIFVVDSISPHKFWHEMNSDDFPAALHKKEIYKRVRGYFPWSLNQLISNDAFWDCFEKRVFG